MAALLGAVAGARELVLGASSPSIDNWTFKLFYQWSTSIFLGASVLVTSNQFFGSPISCDLPQGGVSDDTLKSYCWMYSSFDIPDNFQGHCSKKKVGDGSILNSYYQWVSICLVGQACLFYLPRAIWLTLEGGLMKHLAKDKQGRVIEDMEEKCDMLLYNYTEHLYNKYNRYFLSFFLCEVLNLFISVCQLMITDKFLGHQFLYYGAEVYRFYNIPEEERELNGNYNPMCQAFPRVASCTYFRYGAGGRQEALQALCILGLNIIIDKIYLLIWVWYVIIISFGSFRLCQRCLQSIALYRYALLKLKMHRYFKDKDQCEGIKCYVSNCSMGDWFVLYQMSKNMNRKLFYMFLNRLAKHETAKQIRKKEGKDAEKGVKGKSYKKDYCKFSEDTGGLTKSEGKEADRKISRREEREILEKEAEEEYKPLFRAASVKALDDSMQKRQRNEQYSKQQRGNKIYGRK